MKIRVLLSFLLILNSFLLFSQTEKSNRALILIDIQDFYFPEGKVPLYKPEEAAKNAALLIEEFRKNNELIIHVRHNFEPGGEIHELVKPVEGEKIISKNEVNSFKGTGLKEYLDSYKITDLILSGMQTHMCLEAATRAAHDLDYKCTVTHDACPTRDLTFKDKTIKAEDVHFSTLNTLKSYANVISTTEFLDKK